MSRASEIRAHEIDDVLALIRAAECLLEGRCQDRESGEPCDEEPDRDVWCDSCKLQGKALP